MSVGIRAIRVRRYPPMIRKPYQAFFMAVFVHEVNGGADKSQAYERARQRAFAHFKLAYE